MEKFALVSRRVVKAGRWLVLRLGVFYDLAEKANDAFGLTWTDYAHFVGFATP